MCVDAATRMVRAFYRTAHLGRAQVKIDGQLPHLFSRSKSREEFQNEGKAVKGVYACVYVCACVCMCMCVCACVCVTHHDFEETLYQLTHQNHKRPLSEESHRALS